MSRYKVILVLWLVTLMLAACSSAADEPDGQQEPESAQEVAAQPTPEDEVAPEPTNTSAPAVPTETSIVQSTDSETGEEQPAEPTMAVSQPAPEPQPTATSAPEINGEYEGTFYRGLATAPITMIDYSDFL